MRGKFYTGVCDKYEVCHHHHHPDDCHGDPHLGDVGDVDIVQHDGSSLAAAQPTLVRQEDKF